MQSRHSYNFCPFALTVGIRLVLEFYFGIADMYPNFIKEANFLNHYSKFKPNSSLNLKAAQKLDHVRNKINLETVPFCAQKES